MKKVLRFGIDIVRFGIDIVMIVPACIGYYLIVIRPTQQMQPLYDGDAATPPPKKPIVPSSPLP